MKRFKMVSKLCDRCGNDLMTGKFVMHLPYKKMYIVLCGVCAKGLEIKPELISKGTQYKNAHTEDSRWKKFWEEEYK